jgi:hypothetical protein
MKKRIFQKLDDLTVADDKNGTELLGVCTSLVSADKVKGGGKVSIGVPENELMKVINGDRIPILLLIDKDEYNKIIK